MILNKMSDKFAFLFPGQGSQSIGMLSEYAQTFPLMMDTFKEASDILGYDVWKLTQQDPSHQLNQTAYTQPALLTADIALWRCWLEQGDAQPSVMAGHSLGEYSALVAAGVLSFPDAVSLVSERGHLMQDACMAGEGAMAVIVGLDDEQVEEICAQSAKVEVLSPANYNSYGQVVIAGQVDAVGRAVMMAKEQNAKLAKMISVSVPSHCLLMEPAQIQLAKVIEKVIFP